MKRPSSAPAIGLHRFGWCNACNSVKKQVSSHISKANKKGGVEHTWRQATSDEIENYVNGLEQPSADAPSACPK